MNSKQRKKERATYSIKVKPTVGKSIRKIAFERNVSVGTVVESLLALGKKK